MKAGSKLFSFSCTMPKGMSIFLIDGPYIAQKSNLGNCGILANTF